MEGGLNLGPYERKPITIKSTKMNPRKKMGGTDLPPQQKTGSGDSPEDGGWKKKKKKLDPDDGKRGQIMKCNLNRRTNANKSGTTGVQNSHHGKVWGSPKKRRFDKEARFRGVDARKRKAWGKRKKALRGGEGRGNLEKRGGNIRCRIRGRNWVCKVRKKK